MTEFLILTCELKDVETEPDGPPKKLNNPPPASTLVSIYKPMSTSDEWLMSSLLESEIFTSMIDSVN